MGRVRLLPLALAALLLAGCIQAPAPAEPTASTRFLHLDQVALSPPRFTALPAEQVWIPASTDGAQLHAVVWRPDTAADPAWRAPVILVDTPYRTADQRSNALDPAEPMGTAFYDWLITELVPRGYAVVYKEVRGTGESGGCLEQTASTQRQDGYDAVEWLARQPWSSGKVGMYGKSYLAEAQYGAAILRPPHLVTIVPIASVSGQYEWNFYDGVPFTLHSLVGNAGYAAASGGPPGTTAQGLQGYPGHHQCQAQMLAHGLDMSGDWDAYWQDRELRIHFANITASVLYVHGLQDWNVRQVAVRDSFGHIPSEKREVLGQWHHDHPDANTFVPAWSRTDWRPMVHAWLDHFLLGADNGILERLPPVQVQDSLGAWRAEAAYPPTDAADVVFHLAPQALAEAPPAPFSLALRENEEAFARNATLGAGLPAAVAVPDAPTDQATELVFTSQPLARDLRFSGWPVLRFNLTLTEGLEPRPDGTTQANFAANLDIVGCKAAAWINQGYLSARHRDGVRNPKPVPVGVPIAYTLRLSPADTVVPAGCSLALRLSGSDGQTQPAGTGWSATLAQGTLALPSIVRDLSQAGLDVPMRAPS